MRQNQGVSLIEVMISLFILSLLLLGMDAMQMAALQKARALYYFSVATQQLHVMAEYLSVVQTEDFQAQLLHWNEQNRRVLPRGEGNIQGYYPDYQLIIAWGGQSSNECLQLKIGVKGCLRETIYAN